MMEKLKEEKFDLGMSEFFDICGHGIFKRIGLNKTIVMYSSGMPLEHATYFGLPDSSSFVYDFISTNSVKGFLGRLINFINFMIRHIFLWANFNRITAEAYKVFDPTLDYRELIGNSSYAFVNTDEFVDVSRPITHKYINIAGVGMAKALKNTGTLDRVVSFQKYRLNLFLEIPTNI